MLHLHRLTLAFSLLLAASTAFAQRDRDTYTGGINVEVSGIVRLVDKDELIVGRPNPEVAPDLDLSPDDKVSRRHARITVDGRRAILEDLGSKNGTSVDGRPLHNPRELASGNEILFGTVVAKFVLLPVLSSTETARDR